MATVECELAKIRTHIRENKSDVLRYKALNTKNKKVPNVALDNAFNSSVERMTPAKPDIPPNVEKYRAKNEHLSKRNIFVCPCFKI